MKANAAFATVPVSNMDRARGFYENTLGLDLAGTMPGEAPAALYRVGDSQLLVYQTQARSGDATVASIVVADLDAVMKELRDKGVSFMDFDMPGLKTENGVAAAGGWRGAWFEDPDGNVLAVGEGELT